MCQSLQRIEHWLGSNVFHPLICFLKWLSPLGDLLARFWVARVFFMSGLTKVSAWSSTLMLFQYVYKVPLLPAHLAAYLGAAAEIVLPILLLVGLGGRIMILVFFIYNAVAALSYPFLWTAEGANGLDQHIVWGLLLMMLMFHGAGKYSVDYWLYKRHEKRISQGVK